MELWALALLSGLAAAVVAVAATVLVERLGGALGGALAAMPTTIIPAAVGWAYRLDAPGLALACASVPVGVLIDALFLMVWRYLPQHLPSGWSLARRLAAMVAASMSVWFVLALAYVWLRATALTDAGSATAAGVLSLLAIATVGAGASWRMPPPAPKPTTRPPAWLLAARGVFAGIAIAVAVGLGAVNEVAGGVASTFPAIFTTVMASLWLSHGQALPLSAAAPMALGSTSVAFYSLLYGALALSTPLGVLGAVAVTWPVAMVCVSYPVSRYVRWRGAVAGERVAAEAKAAAPVAAEQGEAPPTHSPPSSSPPAPPPMLTRAPSTVDDRAVLLRQASERPTGAVGDGGDGDGTSSPFAIDDAPLTPPAGDSWSGPGRPPGGGDGGGSAV
jgi:hypothetical protein